MTSRLTTPYGGCLVDLMVDSDRAAELKQSSRDWRSWALDRGQVATLELLIIGGLSPLTGYMCSADARRVQTEMRLDDGTPWSRPVVLGVDESTAALLGTGDRLALRDGEGTMLAALEVEEIWNDEPGAIRIGGSVQGVELPRHFDFRSLRLSPTVLREQFSRMGWRRIAAFQTPAIMHRPQFEQSLRAAKQASANLLIHAESGAFESDRRDDFTTIRCLQSLVKHYPRDTAALGLLPFAFSHQDERDLMLRAIIARNFGCSHLIVDGARDQTDEQRNELIQHLDAFSSELGVEFVATAAPVYFPDIEAYVPVEEAPSGSEHMHFGGEEVRHLVRKGFKLPSWFTFPEISAELQRTYPPRSRQGFTVFFTGLSGAGKSTLAKALLARLMEMGDRPVTLLDGDIVRKNLSSQLGFSREDRDLNIRRIGFVASEITKNRGIALCAPIAPYDETRRAIRETIESVGGFVLVHVCPPIEVCEERDRKGLYAKARAGLIKNFTGVSDPYEEPGDAELTLDTSDLSPEEAVQEVILFLEREGWIGAAGTS